MLIMMISYSLVVYRGVTNQLFQISNIALCVCVCVCACVYNLKRDGLCQAFLPKIYHMLMTSGIDDRWLSDSSVVSLQPHQRRGNWWWWWYIYFCISFYSWWFLAIKKWTDLSVLCGHWMQSRGPTRSDR